MDNKKYYYLKLKENFYDSDAMIVLESMPDGYLFSNILMKLYCRSLKNEGKLMFNEKIPYNPTILAQVTRHQVGTIERCMKVLQELGLIEILDNGAIYMLDIQNYIGQASSEADRIREYRHKIQIEKTNGVQMLQQKNYKSTPEIEIEKDININTEKDKKLSSPIGESRVKKIEKKNKKDLMTPDNFTEFWQLYPRKTDKKKAEKKYLTLKADLHQTIIKNLSLQIQYTWKDKELTYIPHPTTWLNGERWNDAVIISNGNGNGKTGTAPEHEKQLDYVRKYTGKEKAVEVDYVEIFKEAYKNE